MGGGGIRDILVAVDCLFFFIVINIVASVEELTVKPLLMVQNRREARYRTTDELLMLFW